MAKQTQPYVFEVYPIRHVFDVGETRPQLWQWRLKYGRKTMAAGVEMGPGGRHGYASKRGAVAGLKSTARAFGIVAGMISSLPSKSGVYVLDNNVKVVIKAVT
jgi:hypothetical protein